MAVKIERGVQRERKREIRQRATNPDCEVTWSTVNAASRSQ